MSNILFCSDNLSFTKDVQEQISLYAPEYNFYIMGEHDKNMVYDLLIIDDNEEILTYLRDHNIRSPLIFLNSFPSRKLPLLSSDIVVEKPILLSKFLELLKASTNLFDSSSEGCLHFSDCELWTGKKEFINNKNNKTAKLTEKEVAVLRYLYKARERIVSKNELLQEVWGYRADTTTHTIETHIYRLRSKIEDENSPVIISQDGGYKVLWNE